MIADLIAAGDQSGCALLIIAAMPLRYGVEHPVIMSMDCIRANFEWPCCDDVHPRSDDVRLQNARACCTRPPR
ncbi:hypothetical protein U9M48_032411 [Paspalum notatum var. saurae]|uniref:Uncharacterized protein n=1 Tax=Paspalum notatum var. saurae TaxID=547442 RepID=A0AAQ3U5W9_PASNO